MCLRTLRTEKIPSLQYIAGLSLSQWHGYGNGRIVSVRESCKKKKKLWYSRRRRPLRYLVYLPCGLGARVLVRGVAAPEALDEGGGGDAATDHVLLTLLLLHLQGEARTQDALWCAIVSMLLLCFLSNELYTKGKKVAPVVTFCPLLYQGKVVPFQQEVSSSPTLQDRMVQRTKPLTSKESYAKTLKTRL